MVNVINPTADFRFPGRVRVGGIATHLAISTDQHLAGKLKAIFDRKGSPRFDQCRQFRCHARESIR